MNQQNFSVVSEEKEALISFFLSQLINNPEFHGSFNEAIALSILKANQVLSANDIRQLPSN